METPASPRTRAIALAVLLGAVTLLLYWRTGAHGFLVYDDDVYVTANPEVLAGLGAPGARWAFTSGHAANWHPLTWLSHQLDVELFRLAAGAHHRVSALLHALAATLAFLALRALTGADGKSALAAALFALHPLRVESVAWIAERKDVLSGALAFATLWAWAGYARRGGAARYGLALGAFGLGLLAKPMLVTLPFVLLLLDVWPLGRWPGSRSARAGEAPERPPSLAPTHPGEARPWAAGGRGVYALLAEKLPFLALAAASAVVTLLVQRAGGALDPGNAIPLPARLANAVHAAGLYVAKSLVPTGLAVIHPHPALVAPERGPWSAGVLLALAFLVLASAAAVRLHTRAPAVLVGWLAYLGMLVPVSGLVQVGLQGWAERYTYLPSLGLAVAVVWGTDALVGSARARRTLVALALVACGALAAATARQLAFWRDDVALFERALAVEERNPVAHVNLGRAYELAGEPARAEEQYARALALAPALAEAGEDERALAHLRRAVALAPPDLPLVVNGLAWVLATSRAHAAPAEALALAEELCRATGNRQAGFLETLAAAHARLGRFDEAIRWQELALERVPAAHAAPLRERLALYRAGKPYLKSP